MIQTNETNEMPEHIDNTEAPNNKRDEPQDREHETLLHTPTDNVDVLTGERLIF